MIRKPHQILNSGKMVEVGVMGGFMVFKTKRKEKETHRFAVHLWE